MKKKLSQTSSKQDQLENSIIDFASIESRIFTEKGGRIFIGREEITKELRGLLREQAKYIQTSQLWEIMNTTITNEAGDLALKQSKTFDDVLSAKMLYHYGHVFRNLIYILSKD